VNLMPLSVCKKLKLLELSPTNMIIQLADHFIRLPIGILEVTLLQMGKFIISCDFAVMDMDDSS